MSQPRGEAPQGMEWCQEHLQSEPRDDRIDFPCSDLYQEHFYRQGLTPRHPVPPDYREELKTHAARLLELERRGHPQWPAKELASLRQVLKSTQEEMARLQRDRLESLKARKLEGGRKSYKPEPKGSVPLP